MCPRIASRDETSEYAVSGWLASAQEGSEQAQNEWSNVGVALLPLGRTFDVVRLPATLVYAAVGTNHAEEVAERLEKRLQGPVIYDGRSMGGTYYALITHRERGPWEHQDVAPLLGRGTYLGVPKLSRLEPPYTCWIVPPRRIGHLSTSAAVATLISIGREQLAMPPDEKSPTVQAAYRVLLAHTDACGRCRNEAPCCEEGGRIRRALQAARTAATPPMNARRDGGL